MDDFRYAGHLVLVMEAMHINLRRLVKTVTANEGVAIKGVSSSSGNRLVVVVVVMVKEQLNARASPRHYGCHP